MAKLTLPSLKNVNGDKPSWFHRARIPAWLLVAAAICAFLAAFDLHVTMTVHRRQPAMLNLMIVLDFSGSMEAADWPQDKPPPTTTVTADDLPPTRLAVAKANITELLTKCRDNSHIGLVAFARRPYLICPLMDGKSILEERMNQITTDDFEDGTAIGDALRLAVRSLKTVSNGPKAILLFSDGVDHSEDEKAPLTAAKETAQEDIVIHAVGIGGKLAFHPVPTEAGVEWKPLGEMLNEAQMTEISRLANGRYFQANDAESLAHAVKTLAEHVSAQSNAYLERTSVPLTPHLMLAAALLACISLLSRLLLHSFF
ncbi:MAG: VWA domain-containing protein [Victivallales bacterium]|nr:VWA domain-containing protein [Victivallales bacterium]